MCAGYFTTKIFHPNVSKSGEICVNVLKKDWTEDMGLRHVLVVVRILHVLFICLCITIYKLLIYLTYNYIK